ncbi:D-cysteine desulfhydrase family protein [bacterium]|nr:D-cysteine desulfhydrase family protein [bacterium]
METILENKINLGFFPTPLHYLKNLSNEFPDYNIFIKRDDNTGLASGGNKTRKLEYLLKEAVDSGCDTLITAGAQQSNHCRQTAAACSAAGLECHLMLGGAEPEVFDGNLLLSYLLGAEIHFSGEKRKGEDIPLLKEELTQKGKNVYVVPYGGSNFTGALGYVNAAGELKKQLKKQNIKIDYIFFASSSGGTQAGLIIGLDLFGVDAELIPVNIDKDETYGMPTEEYILNLVQKGREKFKIKKDYQLKDIRLVRDYDKAGYGVITDNERTAIKKLAETEGIILDPVYTGRAFYGMLDYLTRKKIPIKSNVLFWHTGGLPSNFYYAEKLK